MKSHKRLVSLFLFCLFSYFLLSTWEVTASSNKPVPVPKNIPVVIAPGMQWSPSVFGNWVVFDDNRNYYPQLSGWDVYAYNIANHREIRVTNNFTGNGHGPKIYGDKIVYSNDPNGEMDIYLFDLSTLVETRITNAPGQQLNPQIYKNLIVWQDGRIPANSWDIYIYDLSTGQESQITNDLYGQNNPAIYGSKIVWRDDRNRLSSGVDIFMYDLITGTESLICGAPGEQFAPQIYGDTVVWQDQRLAYPNSDVFMFNISTGIETQITSSTDAEGYPKIYRDKIVYTNFDSTASDIFLYNISTGQTTRLTDNPTTQWHPDIYKDTVVWMDYRNIICDIYGCSVKKF